jgi:catechol 2,3-dioxygenase-like lactoylglutathione lyase family enzyme
MVAELHVNKLEDSLQFWCELLGFEVAYRRPAEKFVYLERPEGAQIMLCQRHGRFETGPLERPLGQGVMLQVYVDSIDPILSLLSRSVGPFIPVRVRFGGERVTTRAASVRCSCKTRMDI